MTAGDADTVAIEALDGAATAARWSRIRTFKPRRRRLSSARQQSFDRLAPRWTIPVDDRFGPCSDDGMDGSGRLDRGERLGGGQRVERVDPSIWFGDTRPVVLDIGIGIGESCIEMAAADPSINVIGADVHTPGIANALVAIEERGLSNLRVYHGDVFGLIDRLRNASLTGIRVFFPDPWPKPRHHRRRMISSDRLPVLVGALQPAGWLHLATDSADYAHQMQAVCDVEPNLSGGRIERPGGRPMTRFERRGIDAGRPIVDLWYVRSGR